MRYLSILLIFLSFISFSDISAEDKHQLTGVKIKNLSFELEKTITKYGNRSFYLEGEPASHFFNFTLDADVGKKIFVNQKLKSIVGESQFRYVEYNLEIGARVYSGIDLYVRHLSGHALDQTFSQGGFPEDNSIGIRLTLIKE